MNPQVVEIFHALLCDKKHAHNPEDLLKSRDPNICYFYVESQLDGNNDFPDHLMWTKRTQDIIDFMMLSDEQMIKFLDRMSKIIHGVLLLELDFPGAKEILRQVLKL